MIPNKTSLNIENLPARASNVGDGIKKLWGGTGTKVQCFNIRGVGECGHYYTPDPSAISTWYVCTKKFKACCRKNNSPYCSAQYSS